VYKKVSPRRWKIDHGKYVFSVIAYRKIYGKEENRGSLMLHHTNNVLEKEKNMTLSGIRLGCYKL